VRVLATSDSWPALQIGRPPAPHWRFGETSARLSPPSTDPLQRRRREQLAPIHRPSAIRRRPRQPRPRTVAGTVRPRRPTPGCRKESHRRLRAPHSPQVHIDRAGRGHDDPKPPQGAFRILGESRAEAGKNAGGPLDEDDVVFAGQRPRQLNPGYPPPSPRRVARSGGPVARAAGAHRPRSAAESLGLANREQIRIASCCRC
jgi:hypothetical protein